MAIFLYSLYLTILFLMRIRLPASYSRHQTAATCMGQEAMSHGLAFLRVFFFDLRVGIVALGIKELIPLNYMHGKGVIVGSGLGISFLF